MPVANSTARLEARISTDLHSMLKRAAELQGRTMTDFVVAAVQDAAPTPLVLPDAHAVHTDAPACEYLPGEQGENVVRPLVAHLLRERPAAPHSKT